jgi:hypothetical protein
MKEVIKQFLQSIPTIYLPDVYDSVEEICEERGVPVPDTDRDCDNECDHDEFRDQIDEIIESLEDLKLSIL